MDLDIEIVREQAIQDLLAEVKALEADSRRLEECLKRGWIFLPQHYLTIVGRRILRSREQLDKALESEE